MHFKAKYEPGQSLNVLASTQRSSDWNLYFRSGEPFFLWPRTLPGADILRPALPWDSTFEAVRSIHFVIVLESAPAQLKTDACANSRTPVVEADRNSS